MKGQQGTPDRQLLVQVGFNLLVALFHQLEHLAESNRSDDEGSEGNTTKQIHVAKVIARTAGKGIHTHGCEKDTDHCQHHTLCRALANQPTDGGHCHQQQCSHLCRAELQTEVCKKRSHEGKNQHPNQATDEGRHVSSKQGLTRTITLGCHRIAVQCCHDRR
ncbi:hypothetical protein SDC9_63117 [bioreactor metagenome]|uniref:Uncharacterized protein n=1 Tax=bioreactor metagenome TaxID=1076179 RepID=A0A644XKL7_9ZZZZ